MTVSARSPRESADWSKKEGLNDALAIMVRTGGTELTIVSGFIPRIEVDGRIFSVREWKPWDNEKIETEIFAGLTEEVRKEFHEESTVTFQHRLDSGVLLWVSLLDLEGFYSAMFSRVEDARS